MGTYAIELNDSGFSAAGGGQSLSPPSPGYALLDGKDLVVGARAQRQSRLKPRWVNNRFWEQLDASPMPRPFPRALSRADVAHAHLSRLWSRIQGEMGAASQASVLLAVPGSFSAAQLGLILGIARACDLPVAGIVDAATAAVATLPMGERVLHLDATLHRMVWTELVHDGELARRRVEVVETGGLASIWDAWAKRIAELLIRQTRFDPFHHGSADQTLYDRLPDWLEELATSGSVVVTLESESKEHSVELNTHGASGIFETILEPVVELARSLASSEQAATLMVSHRIAAIPGLLPRLSQVAGTEAIVLEDGASMAGSLEHTETIASTGSDLPFVLRLPVELHPAPVIDSTPPPELVAENATADLPTHLLLQGVAHPITTEPLWLGSASSPEERNLNVGGPMPGLSRRHCSIVRQGLSVVVEDHSSFGTFLNGRKMEGTVELETGDRLRLGSPGVEVQVIRVAGDDV